MPMPLCRARLHLQLGRKRMGATWQKRRGAGLSKVAPVLAMGCAEISFSDAFCLTGVPKSFSGEPARVSSTGTLIVSPHCRLLVALLQLVQLVQLME